MKLYTVHLTEKQIEELKKLSDEEGLKVAEIIRRAIDEYLEKKRKEKNKKA